jgi:NTE family protein
MESVFHNNIDTLCFSGGGMKACTFYGALQYLEETKQIDMSKIKTFAGSSIGAITALVLCLGYSITDMIEFTLNFNFGILEPIVNCENIFGNYGLAENNKIPVIIENFIKTKCDKTDLTFLELYELTSNKLIITGSNITDLTVEYFNYLTTPNMSIKLAIQISSCIPIIFIPIKYNDKCYVDGGVADVIPISQCNPLTTLALIIVARPEDVKSIERVILSCFDLAQSGSLINMYNNK